jgi:phosphate transport system substrate-binding protein
VRSALRVSLDFRFRAGTDDLDSRAHRDLDRLVGYLKDRPAAKRMLFGFSDDAREPAVNLKTSQRLADEISSELGARGLRPAVVKGFGAARPLSKPGGADKKRNRRVEVWLGAGA